MHKTYSAVSILLLILLTGAVALGPGFYENKREKSLVQEKNFFKYEAVEQMELSSIQLIDKLIRFGNLRVVAYDEITLLDKRCPSEEKIRNEVRKVIAQSFHDQKDVQKSMEAMISNRIGDYYKQFLFSHEQTNPMFLDLISVSFEDEGKSISFAYEGKTSTLIQFCINYYGVHDEETIKLLEKGLKSYFENILLLKPGEYWISKQNVDGMYYFDGGIVPETQDFGEREESIYYN